MTREFVPRSLITSGIRALPPIGLVAIVVAELIRAATGIAMSMMKPTPTTPGAAPDTYAAGTDGAASDQVPPGPLISSNAQPPGADVASNSALGSTARNDLPVPALGAPGSRRYLKPLFECPAPGLSMPFDLG